MRGSSIVEDRSLVDGACFVLPCARRKSSFVLVLMLAPSHVWAGRRTIKTMLIKCWMASVCSVYRA